MIPPQTNKSIRTLRHIRTMHSIPRMSGTNWQRLRETERIQRKMHRVQKVPSISNEFLLEEQNSSWTDFLNDDENLIGE